MDEEQDFAYAVSEKALRNMAETAGREAPGVVAIRSRSVSVTGGVVHLHLAVRARYGDDLRHLALDIQQRAAKAIETMAEPKGLDISVTIEDLAIPPAE